MTSKEAFLARLQAAGPGGAPSHRPVAAIEVLPRPVLATDAPDDVVERFVASFERVGGHVHRCAAERVAQTVGVALGARGPVLVDERLVLELPGTEVRSWPSCGLEAAAAAHAAVAPVRAAVADTGSVVVDSDQCGRLVTLLPRVAVFVVPAGVVVPMTADVLRHHDEHWPGGLPSNVVLITGPSRSADIEMSLTIDVHGPGEVHVVLVEG